jgi:hypothetical protein
MSGNLQQSSREVPLVIDDYLQADVANRAIPVELIRSLRARAARIREAIGDSEWSNWIGKLHKVTQADGHQLE